MALTSSNMGLKQWDQPNDIFSYTELANNFGLIDQHDHSAGKGVQINTSGIANLAIGTTKIADGAITGTKLASASVAESNLTATAAAKLTPSYVTALPGSPFDGQEIYYQADATNGVIWHLRYRTASPSTYKWEYVGGTPLWQYLISVGANFNSTTVADPSIPGPTLTLPLAGDYSLGWGADFQWVSGSSFASVGPVVGTGGTTFIDSADTTLNTTNNGQRLDYPAYVATGLAISTALRLKFRVGSGLTVNIFSRYLAARPVRVG